MSKWTEAARRLEEIKDEMLNLLDEAYDLVRGVDDIALETAKRHWFAQIRAALDWGGLGSSIYTMQDTIDEMMEAGEE